MRRNMLKNWIKTSKQQVSAVIKKYWDCFVTVGAKQIILGYEFVIDTGGAKPVCCKKTSYGPYESKVIMEQVNQLLHNNWIKRCGGSWGSMVVLAQKRHQEHIQDICDFVWRMCIYYRRLNAITKPFQFPIPRYDDTITIVCCGAVLIWIISLDTRQGYHQVTILASDMENTAFLLLLI